jgi:hypothetical protein
MRRSRGLVLAALLPWSLVAPRAVASAGQEAAPARDATRSAPVTLTAEAIAVDGVLDEPVWGTAPTLGDLVQRQPLPGSRPSEATDVVLLYDADNLYIGVTAYDSEPAAVIGTQMARDANLASDDRVEILLDTFRDQRSAFYFATNPAGALVDGLIYANGRLNTDWDAIWRVRTARGPSGWTAEFAIPFKSLNFPEGRSVWGFNIARTIYRKLEEARWSGARLEMVFLQVSEAGEVTGLEGLSQGIGLDVRPFLAGSALRLAGGGTEFDGRPGLDVFYSITPSLKLTGTFNTDFGETEVDARQINLTRYSLLFPEKRAFFLEDAGVFSFASTGPETPGGIPPAGADVYPFFSRRIGLLGGVEVPIDGGVKLTGRIGRTDMGVMAVRTGALEDVAAARNLFVARVKRNLFQQSYAGFVLTAGDPASGGANPTYGADLRLTTSRFLGRSRNMDVAAYAVGRQREGRSGGDWSYGLSARYPNDKYDAQVALREIPENFDPALGFVQRDDVRMLRIAASYNPRPKSFLGIQQMFHDVFFTHFTRKSSGRVEGWDLYITPLDWHLNSGDSIHAVLDVNVRYERLFEPFQISPGVVLAPDEYHFTRFRSVFSSAAKRRLAGSVNVAWGDYWSGRAEELAASLTFKLPPWLTFSASANLTFARLPEGDFEATILTSRLDYSVSPRLSFFNLVQYDNRSRNLGWQSRARWSPQPGNDVFLVFQQGWVHEPGDLRFQAADRKASAKIQYSIRF